MTKSYLQIRAQTTGNFETKTLLGKDYLVVPVVAMVEGVRHGAAQTSGELGLAEEFGKFPEGWNNSPVVMNHPVVEGDFVSASHPDVLEEYQFGLILGTKLDSEKLKMEAWLDTSQKEKSDDIARVFERVEAHETIEVSVGFFTEVEERKGAFKGQKFTGIWRNIVPDHLAFLSEGSIGACSIEDGCGAPRINTSKREDSMHKTKAQALKQTKGIISPHSNADLTGASKGKQDDKKKPMEYKDPKANTRDCGCGCNGTGTCTKTQKVQSIPAVILNPQSQGFELHADTESVLVHEREIHATQAFINQTIPSEMLSTDIVRSLREALGKKLLWSYVIGFTQTHVVFEMYSEVDDTWKLFRQEFDISPDGEVTFNSTPEEVRLISRIVPVSQIGENDNVKVNIINPKEDTMPQGSKASVKTHTNTGVADPKDPASEVENTDVEETVVDGEDGDGEVEIEAQAKNKPAAPTLQSKLTAQQYIEQAPVEVQDVLGSALRMHNARKQEIVTALTKTGRCKFNEAYLKEQSLETLENLLELAAVPNYSGRALPEPVTQSAGVPEAPKVFNFKKPGAAA